ncbi:MAG TPA: TlpA disulfide reductase family protein [Solirubrobacteraceae bacterium]|jgi:cytochrome c biogenesis protein CcmG/thiol:disulfide interchange protein DsbE
MKSFVPTVLATLAGAALLGLLIYGVTHQAPKRSLDQAIAEGNPPRAPDATTKLPMLSGSGSESLASYRGKVVLLDFWASWCVDCQEEAHQLEGLQHKLEGHDATILGVTYQDVSKDSRAFVKQYGLSYPNLRDGNGKFVNSFGTEQLPENFLIDREGKIVDIARGPVEAAFVKRALALADEA